MAIPQRRTTVHHQRRCNSLTNNQFLEINDDPDEDDKPRPYFKGFSKMANTVKEQGAKVPANPPSQLMWYFGTPRAREYMLPTLNAAGVPSVYRP